MRLRRLALSGIGPFRGEEVIDFDALTRSGLFLIEGPTGAGKSTIIDAITYALYGSVAGGRESTTDRIRSDLADPRTPSYVELEFDVSGSTYLVWRQPAYSRPKMRGEGLIKENAKQSLRALDGSMEPITDAKEIAAAIQRLLGLSVEHFRKLVVLPQGEFDALLRASPADRFEVLGRLIDDGFMARVQEDLVDRAREAENIRAGIRDRIQEIAATLCSRAAEGLAEVPSAADLGREDIATILADLEIAIADAQRDVDSLTAPAQAAADAAVIAEAALARARAGAQALQERDRARAALPEPLRDSPADQLRQRRASVAESIARLEPFVAWESSSNQRESRTAQLTAAVQRAHDQVEALRQRAQSLPAERADLEARRQKAAAVAASLTTRTAEVQRLRSLMAMAEELTVREADLATATESASAAASAADDCRAALLQAREHRVTLLEQRLAHSAAELASRLESGQPCPVCGSPDHPRIASRDDGELITDADVEAAELAVARAETRDSAAAAAAEAAQAAVTTARSTVDQIRGRLDGADLDGADTVAVSEALTEAERAVVEARAAAEATDALAAHLAEIDSQIAALGEETATATAALAEAQAHLAADTERIESETTALRDALGAELTASEAIIEAKAEAAAIDVALDAFEAAAGHTSSDDDISSLEAASSAAKIAASDLKSRLDLARAACTRITATRDAVAVLAAQWDSAHAEIADVLAATDTAVALGALASAQSKANTLRLTLQSYAVQRRFRTVLDAATLHLERMTGSHFAFELDESVGRGHSGLGIAVRDQWSGALRDPKALSGGETFIASLALALGLADVVREENGGVDLQTLFVDEGFGSLDQGSLQQVLDQLDALRSRGRVVGVISHVTEMKDWVHDRVVVEAGRPGQGSRLIQPD